MSEKWLKILYMIITIGYACEAPHHNPLDPKNPDYNFRRLRGTVETISLPVESVPQALVTWDEGKHSTFTDFRGTFEFFLENPASGWLYIHHQDFFRDSLYINWSTKQETDVTAFLNALPVVDTLLVYSSVLNRFPSFQKEQLIVETNIYDRDKDIDSVFALLKDGSLIFHLPYNSTSKLYRGEFTILDLDILSMEELVGAAVQIRVNDIFSNSLIIGQDQLVRVISEEIELVSPANNTVTGPLPTLEWEIFTLSYPFSYDLEIYTNEVSPLMVWQKGNISSDLTSFAVDEDLDPGNYFWVVWAIDKYGNRTRSKPATFSVQL